MTAKAIPDVQGRADARRLAIHYVGIKDIRHPGAYLLPDGSRQSVTATLDMYVDLSAERKGTHMSRFMELVNERELLISAEGLGELARELARRVDAASAWVSARFTLFLSKQAPVSGVRSMMDYQLEYRAHLRDGAVTVIRRMVVPVKTLCPCSKDISQYGAHNQRSHVTLTLPDHSAHSTPDLIRLLEAEGSAELYGVLKRPDEKYVTERAYENPKFVEDLVRDAALSLDKRGIRSYTLEVENFESIHNHSAYARIERS